MQSFRSEDAISAGYILYVLGTLCLILLITYCVLYVSRNRLKIFLGKKNQRKIIELLETKYIPKVGHICVVTISNNKFVVVNSANGVAVSPINDISNG